MKKKPGQARNSSTFARVLVTLLVLLGLILAAYLVYWMRLEPVLRKTNILNILNK